MKTKVAIYPNFHFEMAISAFLDPAKYDIVPIKLTRKRLAEEYGQELFGDWCHPLRLHVAMYEQVIREEGVTKIVDIFPQLCSFPMVMGSIHTWIKADFDYFPISHSSLSISSEFLRSAFKQLKRLIPDLTLSRFLTISPWAFKRFSISKDIKEYYTNNIPLVKNPQNYRLLFEEYQRKFIAASTSKEIDKLFSKFKKLTNKQKAHSKPQFTVAVVGDLSVCATEFSLIELDVFLAKYQIRLGYSFTSNNPSSFYQATPELKKAREIISQAFSPRDTNNKVRDSHIIEVMTLIKLLEGLADEVDGIIFLKPNMCAPCDRCSYILKKNNYFNKPTVEISYDGHSGENGIITRLEAFINILKDQQVAKLS